MNNISNIAKFRAGSNRDIEMLKEGYLWFSSMDKLNDPFEGKAKISTNEDIDRKIKNLPKLKNYLKQEIDSPLTEIDISEPFSYILEMLEKLPKKITSNLDKTGFLSLINAVYSTLANAHMTNARKRAYVFSSSNADDRNILKNPLLWGTYGNSFSGLCIIYDLNEITKQNQNIATSPISYDRGPKLADDIIEIFTDAENSSLALQHPTLLKSHHWKHENEIRLFSMFEGKHYFEKTIIKEIYIAERMNQGKKDEIYSICKNQYPNCEVKLAYFDDNEDNINFRKLTAPSDH